MNTYKLAQRFCVAAIAAMLTVVSPAMPQKVSESELVFREALHKQQVEGDLASAIKLYQNLASSKTADRAVKAKALWQLAGCYEALGKQAETVYLQIVREFGDQPAATQARAKLDALRPPAPPASMTKRKIELGAGVQNIVGSDGHRAVYWDPAGTTLLTGDLAGKDRHVVLQTSRIPTLEVSPDLSMIFIAFPPAGQEPRKYGVMKTDGSGYRDLTLTANGRTISEGPLWLSWSWDNRYVLMSTSLDRVAYLFKISVADGSTEEVIKNSSVYRAMFSPNGRFIAYGEEETGPVHILPAQGGPSWLISSGAFNGGWSRDSRYLFIGELKNGAMAWFAVPLQDGHPQGERIESGLSALLSVPWNKVLGTAPDGSVIVAQGIRPKPGVFLGTLGSEGHLAGWDLLNLVDPWTTAGFPSWSTDGRQIAYLAVADAPDTASIVRVRNVFTGEDREIYRAQGYISNCVWAQQHPALYCAQINGATTEILSISLSTGRAERVGSLDGQRHIQRVSKDDRMLLTTRPLTRTGHAWEIGTDRETVTPPPGAISDDGQWKFNLNTPVGETQRQIRVAPMSDEQAWRRLTYLRIQAGSLLNPVRFSPDSKSIIYHEKDADGKDGLYRVPVSGGDPQRLGDYPISDPSSWLAISPDGRHFLVSTIEASKQQPEIWALSGLEKLLPAPAPGKTGKK